MKIQCLSYWEIYKKKKLSCLTNSSLTSPLQHLQWLSCWKVYKKITIISWGLLTWYAFFSLSVWPKFANDLILCLALQSLQHDRPKGRRNYIAGKKTTYTLGPRILDDEDPPEFVDDRMSSEDEVLLWRRQSIVIFFVCVLAFWLNPWNLYSILSGQL